MLGRAENVPDIDKIPDAKLPELMDQQDTRQVMHISYGSLLQDRNDKGQYRFRNDIYSALGRNEKLLNEMISEHIKKHLHYLGLC